MRPQSAIAKGKELEDYIVDELRSSGLDTRARRTPGSGNGLLKGDIDTDILDFSLECKNTKTASLPEWWKQTLYQAIGKKPAVIWKPPQQPMGESVIIMRFADWMDIVKKAKEPAMINPDRTTGYRIKNLIRSAKELLKELEP